MTKLNKQFVQRQNNPYLYAVLSGKQKKDFPNLDKELIDRKIEGSYMALKGGGRVYRIPSDQVIWLPWDERNREYYLGDDYTGHRIAPLSVSQLREYESKGAWVQVFSKAVKPFEFYEGELSA